MLLLTLLMCWYMIGLSCFVWVIAYPQFDRVNAEGFAAYHRAHLSGTVWVIVPIMILELASGLGVVYRNWTEPWAWVGLELLALVWVVTFGMAVPLHRKLEKGHDPGLVRQLNRAHGYRTAAWVLRGVVLAWAVSRWGWNPGTP